MAADGRICLAIGAHLRPLTPKTRVNETMQIERLDKKNPYDGT